MCVSANAGAREVSMSQEAPLTIKGRAVTMETVGKRQHDVGKLVHLVSNLAVRNFSKSEWDGTLPHFEGFSDGFICGTFADLRGVVLYAVEGNEKL